MVFSKTAWAAGIFAAMAVSTCAPANAEDFFVTPGAGTEGVSLEAGYKHEVFGATAKLSGFQYDWSGDIIDGGSGNVDLRMLNFGGTLDFYPSGGNFRFSAGGRISGNKATGTVTGSDTDATASYDYVIEQKNKFQPYLGIGYSYFFSDNIALDFELGSYYAGPLHLTATGSGTVTVDGVSYDLDLEDIDETYSKFSDIDDSLPDWSTKFYPVAQIGLRVRF